MGTGTGGYHKLHFQTSHSTPYIWRDWSEFMSIFWHSDCCWTRDGIKAKIWYYGKYIFWITLVFYKNNMPALFYRRHHIGVFHKICWRLHNKTHSWNTDVLPGHSNTLGVLLFRVPHGKYFSTMSFLKEWIGIFYKIYHGKYFSTTSFLKDCIGIFHTM